MEGDRTTTLTMSCVIRSIKYVCRFGNVVLVVSELTSSDRKEDLLLASLLVGAIGHFVHQ